MGSETKVKATGGGGAQDQELLALVQECQAEFRSVLSGVLERQGGLTKVQYVNYLSMQVHLTKRVQKYFYSAAAHPSVQGRKALRSFLLKFGTEEAPHFRIALHDLKDLGESLAPITFPVELWHAYFGRVVETRPFLRLGAACYLENLAGTSGDVIDALFKGSLYLRPSNMRFFLIHKHETTKLDHGNLILKVMREADLGEKEWADLVEGARKAAVLYTMMVTPVLG